ncbi:MAG TPA: GNAT family N-acetyltransferase [Candidatus Limnocylindrales bacterium]|nr:GNAT family N-acetyltransferase [Candidatus Limnocylindrales bacterium]
MPVTVRRAASDDLTAAELDAIRAMLVTAFGDDPEEAFGPDDWQHTLGGVHVIADEDGAVVAHAAVVERTVEVGGRPLHTGYVEGVATRVDRRGQGIGSTVMTEVARIIDERFELGMLGTGRISFYERLGWHVWLGPSGFHDPRTGQIEPTADDDGYLMVLMTPSTPDLDPTAPIACEWRPGDVW